jgi:hypothetical protein
LIPDLDDELCRVLAQVRELLRTVAALEPDLDEPPRPHAHAALHALANISERVAPTQSHTGRPAQVGGLLLSSDARHWCQPLRLVWPHPTDLETLNSVAATMGLALATRPAGGLATALALGAQAARDCTGGDHTATELVAALAAVTGMLDLAITPDSRRLAALVATAGEDDLLLPAHAEAPYRRTIARFSAVWASHTTPPRPNHHREGSLGNWMSSRYDIGKRVP